MGSKIVREEKMFKAEFTITRGVTRYAEDSYDKSRTEVSYDSTELSNMTLKATTLEKLKEKINAHTELLSED